LLFARGLELFPEAEKINLVKHLQKTLAVDLINVLFKVQVFHVEICGELKIRS
jgi:hypothetical protein